MVGGWLKTSICEWRKWFKNF